MTPEKVAEEIKPTITWKQFVKLCDTFATEVNCNTVSHISRKNGNFALCVDCNGEEVRYYFDEKHNATLEVGVENQVMARGGHGELSEIYFRTIVNPLTAIKEIK